MKKLINILSKGLAGFLFVALLAANVQIGTGNSLLGIGESSVSAVEASPCDPADDVCLMRTYPDGTVIVNEGKPIIVTPGED